MFSYTDEDFLVTATDGNRYDLRQVAKINPLDDDNYYDSDTVELVFKDGSKVTVDKGDLTGEEWLMLDETFDPM